MNSKQIFLSPRNYILQKARSLPIIECLIETEWKEMGITNVLIVRQEPGGKYTIGYFCVDVFCLGIKNVFCNCHIDEEGRDKLRKSFESGALNVSPSFAHNLIYGAVDYAAELGFSPHKDFPFAENVLDETLIDDGIDEIEFGKNGEPLYFEGPNDNTKQIIAHLDKFVGEGNYKFVAKADSF
ncbi:MAG: hypothetical protein ABI723_17070 [Bacteroidia bacterium]